MSGSIDAVAGEKVRRLVREKCPGCFVLTRKMSNTSALIYNEKTGEVMAEFTSNFELVRRLEKGPLRPTRPGLGVPVNFPAVRKAKALALCEKALDLLIEAEEWLGEPLFVSENLKTRTIARAVDATPLTTSGVYEI